MTVTEQTFVLDETAVAEGIGGALSERTLDILARRRRSVRRRGWLVRRMLLLADMVGLSAAFLIAEFLLRGGNGLSGLELGAFAVTLPIWIVAAKLYGLYDHDEERTDHSTADDLVSVFHMVTVGAWVLFAAANLGGIGDIRFSKLFFFWALAIALVTLGRAAARGYCRRSMTYLQNTIIVGAGDVGQLIARKLLQHPEYGINLVGFVDAQPKVRRDDLEHLTILGTPNQVPTLVQLFDIERVVIAFSNEGHEQTLELIRSLKDLDIQIDIVPRFFEILASRTQMHTVEGLPLQGLAPFRFARSSQLLKRTMDIVGSAIALIVLSPLFSVIALVIKVDSRGPVFFRQVRMGAGNKTFRIFKFRTMVADADARKGDVAHLNKHARNGGDERMFKVPDDPRVTRVGRFLRRYSLDELPQLLNVAKGEMSLVGPRPLILDEDQFVSEWGRKRLAIKPGMTGLWQVLGRDDIPFDEMVRFDYLYVTSWSLWTDVRLILRTIPELFRTREAY